MLHQPKSDTYRIYLTEVDNGLFVVDFTYDANNQKSY